MTTLSTTKAAFGLVGDRLSKLGFDRRKPGIFSAPISDGVIGWVGLNKAIRGQSGAVEINPVVGVRNQRIEQIVAELTGDVFDALVPPTIAGNLGYLTPKRRYLSFRFEEANANEDIADQLCQMVNAHGLPFMKRAADIKILVDTMETLRFGIPEQLKYRIPVGYWLLGSGVKAKAFMATKLAEIGARTDQAAIRYLRFSENLCDRFESQMGT